MQVIALSWTAGVGIFVVVVAVCVIIALLVSRRAVKEDTTEREAVAESDVICPTCGERFASESELGRHVAQYHPDQAAERKQAAERTRSEMRTAEDAEREQADDVAANEEY